MVDLNRFNDRSNFKGLDQSVAFDMKGHEDSVDQRSLAPVALAVERIVVAVGADQVVGSN